MKPIATRYKEWLKETFITPKGGVYYTTKETFFTPKGDVYYTYRRRKKIKTPINSWIYYISAIYLIMLFKIGVFKGYRLLKEEENE